jgi:catechol 2,3-dioxygenase-like lactoylglutathione lyase family enzyme
MIVHTILYVADQERSTSFYQALLSQEPVLNVPGMTEFQLSEQHVLGLMPERGIKRLLGDKISDPASAQGVPRAERAGYVSDPDGHVLAFSS